MFTSAEHTKKAFNPQYGIYFAQLTIVYFLFIYSEHNFADLKVLVSPTYVHISRIDWVLLNIYHER